MTTKNKYLLKIGFFWAAIMALVSTGLEAWQKDDFGIFLSWKFLVKFLVFFVVGLGVGLFNWKELQKERK